MCEGHRHAGYRPGLETGPYAPADACHGVGAGGKRTAASFAARICACNLCQYVLGHRCVGSLRGFCNYVAQSKIATLENVNASALVTPSNKPFRKRVKTNDSTSPRPTPASIIFKPWPSTRRITSCLVAPSDTRMPISWVRWRVV